MLYSPYRKVLLTDRAISFQYITSPFFLILLGWGIVQVGLSLQSHDPSQRSNGFLTLAGGVIITFAKEILTLITGA